MTANAIAISVLAAYLAIAAGLIFWQAYCAKAGPMAWFLYAAERIVCGLLWRVRAVSPDGQPARCPFPADSGALIVANHRSPADPVILWQNHHMASPAGEIRMIRFLMAREFYNMRGLRWFYRAMKSIPVTRGGQDVAAVRQTLAELKDGHLVGIFPEGGINHGPPGLKEAGPGVAFLALNTNAPVYPVYIDGSPVGPTLVTSIFRRARTRLVYGPPIDLSQFRGQRKSPELLHEITETIMTAIAQLGGVPYSGAAPPVRHRSAPRKDIPAAVDNHQQGNGTSTSSRIRSRH